MKRLLLLSFQFIGLVLVAQTQFGPKVLLDATLHTQDIETIDVNNDGFQDIIVSESLYFSLSDSRFSEQLVKIRKM